MKKITIRALTKDDLNAVVAITAPRDHVLLGFLLDAGFKSSQRMAFTRPITP